MPTLLDLVRRHADAHADPSGVAPTGIPGLSAIRALSPGALQATIYRPLIAMVLQGAKQVTMGAQTLTYAAGEALLVSADVPTLSQITRASPAEPYCALVLELNPALLADFTRPGPAGAPLRVQPTDADVLDTALRLMRLVGRPEALEALSDGLLREMHYWLCTGRHGAAIASLAAPDSHAGRIARAVAEIRVRFAQALRTETLAALAGMSESAFHQHFRAVTTLSPLQFQKQLRLIEARRLMLAETASIARAAHAVGYESVPQFTRDYARLFNAPPGRDLRMQRAG